MRFVFYVIYLFLVARDQFSSFLFDIHCSKCIFRFVVFRCHHCISLLKRNKIIIINIYIPHIQMHQNASSESYSLHCRFLCCQKFIYYLFFLRSTARASVVYYNCISHCMNFLFHFVFLLFSLSTFVMYACFNSLHCTLLFCLVFVVWN